MRTRTVLLFIVLAASLFGTAGTEEREPPQPGCDEILRDTCSKSATPLDVTCSIIGFIGSALVIMFPSWRLWCMFHGPEDIIGDRWFMVFLLVGTADYAAWVGYAFRGCGYCQATPYMKGISVLGCVFTLILSLIGLARDKGRLTAGGNTWTFMFLFVSYGVVLSSTVVYSSLEISIWLFVALQLLAQLCRVISTDYSEFSKLQVSVSIIGAVSGFLCLRHPHLVAAIPYWRCVFYVAIFRLVETMVWLASYFGINLTPRRFVKYVSDRCS